MITSYNGIIKEKKDKFMEYAAQQTCLTKKQHGKGENMRKKKSIATLLAVTLLGGLLSGCTNTPAQQGSSAGEAEKETEKQADTKEEGKTNLKFYIWSDEENYMQEVVDTYNTSQSDVTVELVSIPNDSYEDKLKVMLSAGSDADIVDIRTLNQVVQFREAGALLDLTEMIKTKGLDISKYGSMWDDQYPDGKMYALPTRSTCWMLFYNEDILKEEGITMPDQLTWEEYAQMAKKLTKEDGSRYGGYWINWDIYHVLATQKGTYLNSDDITDVKDSLEFINRLMNVDKSHVSMGEVQATNAQYLADFENGKAVMMPQGEWLINMLITDKLAKKTDINWSVAPMPVPEGVEAGTTWGQFQFAGIPATAKNPEASYDFLQYLCGEGGSVVLPKYGMLPAYAGDEAKQVFKDSVQNERVVNVVFQAKKVLETPAYDKYSQLIQNLKEDAELYFLGEKTLDETMANYELHRKEVMGK